MIREVLNNKNYFTLLSAGNPVDFCSDPNILKVMKLLGTLITVVKIVIPVILVLIAMIKLFKAVIGDEDYPKLIKNLLEKVIIALIIFFIPSILNGILGYARGYSNSMKKFTDCTLCLTDSTSDNCKKLISSATAKYESKLKAEEDKVKKEREEAIARAKKEDEDNKKKAEIAKKQREAKASSGGISNPNNIPYYSQGTGPYRTITLSDGSVYTNYNCGCGFTSLAMVIDGLSGQSNTPIGIINYFNPHTYAGNFCPIYDSTLINSKIKTNFGITPNVLINRSVVAQTGPAAEGRKQTLVNSLESGHAIIVLVPDHYITLAGIENGLITVLDPGNSANNGKYTIDALWDKYYNHKNRCNSMGACGIVYAVEYSK